MHVLMLASENDGIEGGKIGGIGDVLRDVPPALAKDGCRVTVITPSYGFLHEKNVVKESDAVSFSFNGQGQLAVAYEVKGKRAVKNVSHWVIDSLCIHAGGPRIYADDPPDNPFSTDAFRFACFCTAAAEGIRTGAWGEVDVVHLHDWHAAFFAILREYHAIYRELKPIRTVFTIHNLAYQGVRPFNGYASLNSWFPGMWYDYGKLVDPRWPSVFNPMASGIRLSDAVHAVSPTYAEEITRPTWRTDERAIYGGEGLEREIAEARGENRLLGILNGCDYSRKKGKKPSFKTLADRLRQHLVRWAGTRDYLLPAHFIAYAKLDALARNEHEPEMLLTSVGRITEQKMLLMQAGTDKHPSGLEGVLDVLGENGLFILLGTGESGYENFLSRVSGRYDNFIFLCGYSDECANLLYRMGDLFVMPSSFEPCGISQMLAMREGQPPLVHHVGGLRDTVEDGVNGFAFTGETIEEQVNGFVETVRRVIKLKRKDASRYKKIREKAKKSRFLWGDTVRAYKEKLYT